ncbi:MAG: bifunctional folylpolyglutamate synthase/dihydrofolate synthase [Anaerolineae bacterium]
MDYRRALQVIFERSNFERQPQPPYAERVYRLDRMRELLSALGNPQQHYRAVHVAGTKGKGSVTALIESALSKAGYRTGMYTSPHLHTFRERIRIAGIPASEEQVCDWMEQLYPVLANRPEVTVFEAITALAMIGFAESQVEIGVFEVGMGGRLDATNVLEPLVSVITPISLDHIGVLGDTIAAIAFEKAGIIKPGIPVVISPQVPEALAVFRQVAVERGSELIIVPERYTWQFKSSSLKQQDFAIHSLSEGREHTYILPLLGEHQIENAATALTTLDVLSQKGFAVSPEAVAAGFESVQWPGRMEILSEQPLLVVDGAHNGHSIERLLSALHSYLDYSKLTIIFGVSSTHKPLELLETVGKAADKLIVTQSIHSKAFPMVELADHANMVGIPAIESSSVADAVRMAVEQARAGELIVVTGSLFVVAEARAAWFTQQGLALPPGDPEGVY